MPNRIKWRALGVLFACLTSCTPKPPDVPACESLTQHLSTDPVSGHLLLTPSPTCIEQIGESECGHCVYIVSGKEFFIGEGMAHQFNGKPWSVVKAQSVMLPAVESYAPLAKYVIDSCKQMGCSGDVTKFKVKLDSLKNAANALP